LCLDEEEQTQEGWDYIPVGEKRIGIHTSGLEEKATACNMIYCYVSELGEGFFPYVEEVAKITVPLMRFYYHDDILTTEFIFTYDCKCQICCYFDYAILA
jgi:hypothetical protein